MREKKRIYMCDVYTTIDKLFSYVQCVHIHYTMIIKLPNEKILYNEERKKEGLCSSFANGE